MKVETLFSVHAIYSVGGTNQSSATACFGATVRDIHDREITDGVEESMWPSYIRIDWSIAPRLDYALKLKCHRLIQY